MQRTHWKPPATEAGFESRPGLDWPTGGALSSVLHHLAARRRCINLYVLEYSRLGLFIGRIYTVPAFKTDPACGSMVFIFYCVPFSALRAENGTPKKQG